MSNTVCSWPCLGAKSFRQSPTSTIPISNPSTTVNQNQIRITNPNQNPDIIIRNQAPISYIDRVRGQQPLQIDVAALPSPIFIGGIPTVTLPRAVVERGRKYLQFALIGRVDFSKVSLKRLQSIAAEVWLPVGEWKIIPLGKGFFMFRLESKDDFVRIWVQAWKIGDQTLHFMKWTPDFDTEKQRTSNALLWVQFPKLGQQYWDYEALMAIRKRLGTPIDKDQKMLSRENGYYANVLIDIDMSQPIPFSVNVKEEEGKQFSQEEIKERNSDYWR